MRRKLLILFLLGVGAISLTGCTDDSNNDSALYVKEIDSIVEEYVALYSYNLLFSSSKTEITDVQIANLSYSEADNKLTKLYIDLDYSNEYTKDLNCKMLIDVEENHISSEQIRDSFTHNYYNEFCNDTFSFEYNDITSLTKIDTVDTYNQEISLKKLDSYYDFFDKAIGVDKSPYGRIRFSPTEKFQELLTQNGYDYQMQLDSSFPSGTLYSFSDGSSIKLCTAYAGGEESGYTVIYDYSPCSGNNYCEERFLRNTNVRNVTSLLFETSVQYEYENLWGIAKESEQLLLSLEY